MTRATRLGRLVTLGFALAIGWSVLPLTAGTAAAENPAKSADADAACGKAPAGYARCFAMISHRPATAHHATAAATPNGVTPNADFTGYGPADLAAAYALPTGGSEGTGMTVAVVDAFDQPNAEADLAAYRTQFGLPACTTANGCFKKVNQSGVQGSYPPDGTLSGWAMEIDLDIQMVSAVCPNCKIVLVEANSAKLVDLAAAEVTAVNLGANAVTNSYGGVEGYGEVTLDAFYNHPGVAIVASTGDCGYNCGGTPEYPAASQFVIAVGGTTLTPDASERGWSETAWGSTGATPGDGSGAGSGCSFFESKPVWQSDTGCANRMVADVSAVADPNTGVASYFNGSWYVIGGTSAAAPIIAGTYALAGGVPAGQYPGRYLYSQASALRDVVGGNNDVWQTCTVAYFCNGVAGYDGPTGLGTPNGLTAFTAPAPPPVKTSTYYPVTPTRILDTRIGQGLSGAFQAGNPRTFPVTGGVVPGDATAVTGNLTVTQQTSKGWLYVGPEPLGAPTSSTLNFPAGDNRANNVTVQLGTHTQPGNIWGTLSITYGAPAGSTAHVIFDVTGYFKADQSGATYHPLDPARILDTRTGTGLGGTFSSMSPRALPIWGADGIPASAVAVTGNLTVTQQTAKGYLYIGTESAAIPSSSTLNFPVGDNRANGVTAKLTPDGKVWINYVAPYAGPTAHVIFDVTGYYSGDVSGQSYVPLTPRRILDTRYGIGMGGGLMSSRHRVFGVTGGDVPGSALAVTGNLTVTQQTSKGYLYLGPQDVDVPTSSTLNFPVKDNRANGVTVKLAGANLSTTFVGTNSSQVTQVIFDLSGYFTR